MSDDVAPDWLRAILREAHAIGVCYHLIGQNHSNSKLFCHACKLSQEPAASSVVYAQEVLRRVRMVPTAEDKIKRLQRPTSYKR